MSNRQEYTKAFKDAICVKLLNRGPRSVAEVCKEEGVKYSTADNWIRKRAKSSEVKTQKSSNRYSAEQKLSHLIKTGSLLESELGLYLRKEGLHSHQLEEWRREILFSMNTSKMNSAKKDDRDQKIKALEREVLRKDKALAEASSLLILQKKVSLIWGKSDEGEA